MDEHAPDSISPEDIQADINAVLGDLVRRALIEVGQMQMIQEHLRDITERASKLTPPPEKPDERA